LEHIDKVAGTFGKRGESGELLRSSVSPAVIRRLPRYHRYLGELLRNNRLRISSSELSKMMKVTASQIRQDLNCFGGFGQQGYGYNVKYLYGKISELLGVSAGLCAIVVGAGNLGRALVSSHMFERRGVTRLAMFDVDPSLIGRELSGLPVHSVDHLESFCEQSKPDIAVLTTPKEAAYEVSIRLAKAGIRGIWNFSNMELRLDEYPEVIIQNIHLGDSLMTLCYELVSSIEPITDEHES
jgi:redox-sensing transcriptional repressor